MACSSLALAIIGDIVPPRERAKYQGYFLAVFGTASVLGPVIGGFLAGQETILGIDGWRWIFLVNVPIGIAALAVVSKTLHLRHQRLDHRLDWAGAALLSVALVPLLLVAEQGREWGWSSNLAIACYVIGVVAAIGFFWQEARMGEEAILPLAMFRNRTVGVASAASVLIGVAMFGGLAALPLYLQIVKGATPTEAGLLLLPMTLGIMIGSILSGQIIARTGRYRMFPIVGSALLTISLFVFHYVAYDTPLWQTMIVMLAFGMGLGFNFQPLTLAVQNAVPQQQIGVATSTATFTRQIGGTLGTAVFLSILFSTASEKITTALTAAVPTADFQAALADPANAAAAEQFAASQASGGAAAGVLQDSSFLTGLDERLAKPFLIGFSEAMDLVFLTGAAVMVFGFIIMLFLPNVELRKSSGYSERATDEPPRRGRERGPCHRPPLSPTRRECGSGRPGHHFRTQGWAWKQRWDAGQVTHRRARPRLPQRLRREARRHPHDVSDPRPDGREHPVGCVLARERGPGIHPEPLTRQGVARRVGLSCHHVGAGDDDIEAAQPAQRRERLVGPPDAGRRHERKGDAGHSGTLHARHRARHGIREPVTRDESDDLVEHLRRIASAPRTVDRAEDVVGTTAREQRSHLGIEGPAAVGEPPLEPGPVDRLGVDEGAVEVEEQGARADPRCLGPHIRSSMSSARLSASGPTTTWTTCPAEMTPCAPAAFSAASSTRDTFLTSVRSRVMHGSISMMFSGPPRAARICSALVLMPGGSFRGV